MTVLYFTKAYELVYIRTSITLYPCHYFSDRTCKATWSILLPRFGHQLLMQLHLLCLAFPQAIIQRERPSPYQEKEHIKK